ncbi:lipocalin family protein [Flavobacteriaceae bacterium]|nr:lipocalin family protein [Flavobacteriaceae bacterium]
MKTTKQTILMSLLFLAAFSACKSDDDTPTQDSIIGSWQLEQTYTNGVSDDILDCQKMSTSNFLANGTFNATDYSGGEDICESDSYGGTWSNSGNDIYTIIIMESGLTQEIMLNITFPNGKLTILQEDQEESNTTVSVRTN